jgi:hypothetical protein
MASLKANQGCKIGDLISDLNKAEIKEEYRMKIKLDDFKEYGQKILSDLKEFIINKIEKLLSNYDKVQLDLKKY